MIGYPLDSDIIFEEDGTPQYDRAVSSQQLRKLYKTLYSDGILPDDTDNLRVVTSEGMTVVVLPGFAIVNGCLKWEENEKELIVQAAGDKDRIDSVVMRLNDNDNVRSCELYIKQGAQSQTPTRPSLTRNASIWEIGLADIYITAKSSYIPEYRISDTRYETAESGTEDRCGVISPLGTFDTGSIYKQIQSDLKYFKETEEASFEEWFELIKGQLSEDAAGHLQNQINELRDEITSLDLVHLILTADETISGATITAVNGEEVLTAIVPPSGGKIELNGKNLGSWIITEDVKGTRIIVDTTFYGNYYITLGMVPDGATAEPINDVQLWLKCASIYDKDYTTISQVLADNSTLSTLISNENAVKYMVRSTGFANDICSNSNAMVLIGLDNNCSNSLLDDNIWLTAIANSNYIGSVLNVSNPTMTSNTAPSGTVKASASQGGEYSYPSWHAFDDKNNGWATHWWAGNIKNANISYTFANRSIKIYLVIAFGPEGSYSYNASTSGNITLYIDEEEIQTKEYLEKKHKTTFMLNKIGESVKLDIASTTGYACMGEIKIYGREDV